MRKIMLNMLESTDEMYDTEINPTDYEFFVKHIGTFKRMWEEQTKDFWIRYVMSFRVYHVKHGCIQGQLDDYTFIIDQGFIYIHEEFLEGKYSHAKNFMMDIALVAQKRNMLACLDPGNYAKNPFYRRETRDVFRRLFGHPDHNDSYMKVCLLFPLYCKFGGSICVCLRRWLAAPDMSPSDNSYWTPPQCDEEAVLETKVIPDTDQKEASKTDKSDKSKKKDTKDTGGEGVAEDTSHFQTFWNERSLGNPTSPVYVEGWPKEKNPRMYDRDNPLYDPGVSSNSDWREGINYVLFVRFLEYCRETYLKLPARNIDLLIPDGAKFEKCRKMLLKDKLNESAFPTKKEFWQNDMPTLGRIKDFEKSHAINGGGGDGDCNSNSNSNSNGDDPSKQQTSDSSSKKKRKRKKKAKEAQIAASSTPSPPPETTTTASPEKDVLKQQGDHHESIHVKLGRLKSARTACTHQCVNCNTPLSQVTVVPGSMCQDPQHGSSKQNSGNSLTVADILTAMASPQEKSNDSDASSGSPKKHGSMKVVIEKRKGDTTIVKTTIEHKHEAGEVNGAAAPGTPGKCRPRDESPTEGDTPTAPPLLNEEVQMKLLQKISDGDWEIPQMKGHSAVIHGRGKPAEDGKPTYNMSFKFENLPDGSSNEDIIKSKQGFVENINRMVKNSEEPDLTDAIRLMAEKSIEPRTRDERQREKLRKKLAVNKLKKGASLGPSKVERAKIEDIANSLPKCSETSVPKEHPTSKKIKKVERPPPRGIFTDDEDEDEEMIKAMKRKDAITERTTDALIDILLNRGRPSKEHEGVVLKHRKLRICSSCHIIEPEPKAYKKCQKCKELGVKRARYYCGRACQIKDWAEKHKIEHRENVLE